MINIICIFLLWCRQTPKHQQMKYMLSKRYLCFAYDTCIYLILTTVETTRNGHMVRSGFTVFVELKLLFGRLHCKHLHAVWSMVRAVLSVQVIWSWKPQVAVPWWFHQMETFSALLALCAGKSPATGDFPSQRPVTQSFDVFFDLRLNKPLSTQSWGWWFETPSRSLWCHYNAVLLAICVAKSPVRRFRCRDCYLCRTIISVYSASKQ